MVSNYFVREDMLIKWVFKIQLAVIFFAINSSHVFATSQDAEMGVTVEIDTASDEGRLPPIFAPSVFASWADRKAQETFFQDAETIGLVRLSVEQAMSTSRNMEDYVKQLQKLGRGWKQLENKKARIVLTVARMPIWLSSQPSREKLGPNDFVTYEASPPKSYTMWSQLVYETVKYFKHDLGLDLYYELWNEPDSKGFWLGTEEEYFRLYKYFVMGARRADPYAKVGGPTLASPSGIIGEKGPHAKPSLCNFIKYASSESVSELNLHRLPIDFLAWHQFNADPNRGWIKPVREISACLRKHNYSKALLIVDEWALWGTKDFLDPLRDTEVSAAYIAATLSAMNEAGIDFQTIATLQDFSDNPDNLFHGDFGILTKQRMGYLLKKPAYNATMMFNHLVGGRRVKTVVRNSSHTSKLSSVGAIASKDSNRLTLIVWNYVSPAQEYFLSHLEDLGYSPISLREELLKHHPGLSHKELFRLVKNKNAIQALKLPDGMKAAVKAALAKSLEARRFAMKGALIDVKLLTRAFPAAHYQRFAIDSSHSNSYSRYIQAKQRGQSEGEAAKFAQRYQALEKVEEKSTLKGENVVTFMAEPYSVHLLTFSKN